EEVVIKAYIRKGSHRGDDACSELKTVKLSAPLGSRALRGCNPDSSVYRVEGLSDRDCAAGNVITEWPAMQKLTDLRDGIVNASTDREQYIPHTGPGAPVAENISQKQKPVPALPLDPEGTGRPLKPPVSGYGHKATVGQRDGRVAGDTSAKQQQRWPHRRTEKEGSCGYPPEQRASAESRHPLPQQPRSKQRQGR